MKKFAIGFLVFAALVWIFWRLAYPSITWNERLTLVVETPDGLKTGSAVIQRNVTYHPNVPVDAGIKKYFLRGEATVVDLGNGQYIFALLPGGRLRDGQKALRRAFEADLEGKHQKRYYRAVQQLAGEGAKPVPFRSLPLLVTFRDLGDPTSAMVVDPNDLGDSFGEGYALREATLDVTDDAVTEGVIGKVLSCLDERKFCTPSYNELDVENPLRFITNSNFRRRVLGLL